MILACGSLFAPGQLDSPTLVTKDTQVKLGVEFNLTATQLGDSVAVRLVVPRSGKLKQMVGAGLMIRDTRRISLSAPMAIFEQPEGVLVNFLISKDLARDAYLVITLGLAPDSGPIDGRGPRSYSIRLREYAGL